MNFKLMLSFNCCRATSRVSGGGTPRQAGADPGADGGSYADCPAARTARRSAPSSVTAAEGAGRCACARG